VEKAICGSGKRALNLPKAVTHRPAEAPLPRAAPEGHRRLTLGTSAKKASEEEGKKNHASEKAPCSPETTCQPALHQSPGLPGPPASPMQQALQQGTTTQELLENPASQECDQNRARS